MKTAFSLAVFLLALSVMESCVSFGAEARRVCHVYCNSDDDCRYICPPGTAYFKCVNRLCECDVPENFAAKPKTLSDAKDSNRCPEEVEAWGKDIQASIGTRFGDSMKPLKNMSWPLNWIPF